jgi:hypothetical protein
MRSQSNPELSTGLAPIKAPTVEEQNAVRDLNARLTRDAEGLDARVAKIERDAEVLKQARDQDLGPTFSPEVIERLVERGRRRSA